MCLAQAPGLGCSRSNLASSIDSRVPPGLAAGGPAPDARAGTAGSTMESAPPFGRPLASGHAHFVVKAKESEWGSSRSALLRWDALDRPLVGFESGVEATDFHTMQIDPATGAVVMRTDYSLDERRWRTWQADGEWSPDPDAYPEDPGDNDPALVTPGCAGPGKAFWVWVKPEGGYIYQCAQALFADDGRQLVYSDDWIAALTYGEVALVEEHLRTYALVDLATGTRRPATDLNELLLPRTSPEGGILLPSMAAIRAAEDGFFIVFDVLEDGAELWQLDRSGRMTSMGVYPSLPAGIGSQVDLVLDQDFNLVQGASSGSTDQDADADVIVVRSLQGRSEVLYDVAEFAPVSSWPQVWISTVFTGP